ncbi:murein DD-endopeptidase MepM/ murein hydrolase activator NlpD [Roseiarcus fermentans]|uniref:Murein DD-endopeptidase MepM/ murein hydrolase activator NlpD n=1 Tax=Roseiarcus fermentans TaxID=1473586 RepID=A0A366EKU7_9HYPH|nr:M23 family metallopeptidase [Roseiarcus fermentans]RBP02099.1 murein DD-endopeptidase MepM/ murein hydrolase activator NlpD [Roseiarcus fermentans]
MNAVLSALVVAAFALAPPALAADPHPPQVTVSFLAEPAPIVQEGATKLVYEMALTNVVAGRYVVDSIEARAGDTDAIFDAKALAAMTQRFDQRGAAPAPGDPLTLEGGRGAVVFLMLDLGKAQAPATILHRLRLIDDKGVAHVVEPAPLAVAQERPIVVGPPLRGQWIAGDSVHNGPDAAHRRAMIVFDGRAFIAQRYAIDWMQVRDVDSKLTTWKGPEDQNASYFCYDQPILSVADGTVVAASDGMAENVPHAGTRAEPITADNVGGNHVVIEIAPHRYAFYAHIRPGTVTAKVGERVHRGDVIGRVGNSGNSTEPHLHFHIDDQPSFLAGDGVPYAFDKGLASGAVQGDAAAEVATFGAIGPQKPFVDDYPAENALVTFE